jgi:alkanesulfonate monooxygenase SsuD/methylene tetrahydromethanopterin reductase-like flavin-dependent oxidoreductase (luciferase family)
MTLAAASTASSSSTTTNQLRFGVMLYPDANLLDLPRQTRWLEDLGFDQAYLPDHSADPFNRGAPWFDGWSVLPALATATERIRIGTLVSNPILRPPATLARQAMTVDQLSGGRLDLGIGAGVFDFDHHAVGEEPWSPKERAGRFADYVAILDGILRGTGEWFAHEGEWFQTRGITTAPGTLQRPRPTLVTGGQSPTVLRVTAERADVWNTIGPMIDDGAEILATTARQNRQLDEMLEKAGRDPKSLRRSYAVFGPFDLWEHDVTLEVVERFGEIGMTEFVLGLPPADRLDKFEQLAQETIPALRTAWGDLT